MNEAIALVLILGLLVLMVWGVVRRFKKENGVLLHAGKKIALTILEVPIFFILSSLILALSGSTAFCESSYSCNGSGIMEKISAQLCCEGSGIGVCFLHGESSHYAQPQQVASLVSRSLSREVPKGSTDRGCVPNAQRNLSWNTITI